MASQLSLLPGLCPQCPSLPLLDNSYSRISSPGSHPPDSAPLPLTRLGWEPLFCLPTVILVFQPCTPHTSKNGLFLHPAPSLDHEHREGRIARCALHFWAKHTVPFQYESVRERALLHLKHRPGLCLSRGGHAKHGSHSQQLVRVLRELRQAHCEDWKPSRGRGLSSLESSRVTHGQRLPASRETGG